MFPAFLQPQWPVHGRVLGACSGREGGVSAGTFASLNLGDHVGDDREVVAENRRRFAESLGAHPVFLRQVHGTGVVEIGSRTPDGTEADACFTREPGVACTIMVADCMPVLFADEAGTVVAAAHAGWRGLAGHGGTGVLEATVRTLESAAGVSPASLLAWLGPCIGPGKFEVGPEVREAFTTGDPGAASAFAPQAGGKFLADLPALAHRRLAALGVSRLSGNDGTVRWCTVSNPSLFFSHRRDRASGRFAAAVVLR